MPRKEGRQCETFSRIHKKETFYEHKFWTVLNTPVLTQMMMRDVGQLKADLRTHFQLPSSLHNWRTDETLENPLKLFRIRILNFAQFGSGTRMFLNPDLDPDKGFLNFFLFKNVVQVLLSHYKGLSCSRRSLQPNRELFKHEISLFFPF